MLLVGALRDTLGANPIETVLHVTGTSALRFLLLCLAITPLRRVTGFSALAPWRRTLGLIAFAYASLHIAVWALLDVGELAGVLEDLRERPFIVLGSLAFVCLLLLALSSTRGAVRRLGARRWLTLHRLIHPAAMLVIAHYAWGQKSDLRLPLAHAAVLALLLAVRVTWRPHAARLRHDSARTSGSLG
jgi:sulfoxide reductase heme-binding subunit YedZ